MPFYITKYSGDKELFDIEKFKRSLSRSGASPDLIQKVAAEIEQLPELRNTHDIYQFALKRLQTASVPIASRYALKQALLDFGPTGFPFEQFVAQIFKKMGYTTLTDQTVPGACVVHEVDVVAQKNSHRALVECKFHNQQALSCDVKVPLYIDARFRDIVSQAPEHHTFHEAWIVTNTRFTTDAVQYAHCANIRLLGWSYPVQNNLQQLIDLYGLYPITTLTSLSSDQKKELITHGVVLCSDAAQHKQLLQNLGFSESQAQELIEQAQTVCTLRATAE